MKLRPHFFAALSAVGILAANVANAVPLTLYGSYSNKDNYYDAADDRGVLDCSIGCSGLTSSLLSGYYTANVPSVSTQSGFNTLYADLFYLGNNSEASELAFVNAVLNPDYSTGTRTDTGGATSYSFTSSALYLLLKIGASPDMALIYNSSGQTQTYSYTAYPGEGAGLSHLTEYGRLVKVPEPETFALFGAGLLAMAFVRRRRTAAVAA